jgi:hypothetical protein
MLYNPSRLFLWQLTSACLLEEIAHANRELNNENRHLRDELKKRDDKNKRIIRGLENKIDAVVSSPSENGSPPVRISRRRRRSACRIPAQCRVCHFEYMI